MTDGYPDDEDIEWLKEQLNQFDFHVGALAIKQLIDATEYGKATLEVNPPKLEIATGGWSGCEEILEATHGTLWRMSYWYSSHRGGLEVFLKLYP